MPLAEFTPMFAEPVGSPIRELFPYLSRPGMISLAGGYPSASLLDAQGLAMAAQQAMQEGSAHLQYGATEGIPSLRKALAQQALKRGMQARAEDILVTTGSQQGFDLLVRVLISPGDAVLVEVPAYPATLQALRLAQVQMLSIPMDADGLDTEALAQLLSTLPSSKRPKLLYTVPNFSNPRGSLLSANRRTQLVQLALQYGFWIVEDDPYGELRFDAADDLPLAMPPSLYTLAQQMLTGSSARNPVIYLSSLSKTVAPALRVGWMLADATMLRRCSIAKQTSDLCTSPLAQAIAAAYLAGGRYAATVECARREYQRRMQALTEGLLQLPGQPIHCTVPAGGMFVWAQLAPALDAQLLFDAAVDNGVVYVPGHAFYPDQPDVHTLRMSFAAPEIPDIQEAVQRLARACERTFHGKDRKSVLD